MKNVRLAICLVAVGVMVVANVASAEIIRGINMDFVSIGNAGNSADTTGFGAVGYNYRIGKYEVTNAQWNTFKYMAGTPTGNPTSAYDQSSYFTSALQPNNCVSWYEAAQFCNYLTSGNKRSGAYQLATDGSITVDRAAAIATYGTAYVIPTENEWYKAAYFKPNGSGYSLYSNGTNTAPSTSQACYNSPSPWPVGSGMQEQNGTFDMLGNVREFNETFLGKVIEWDKFLGYYCGCKGSAFDGGGYTYTLASTWRGIDVTYSENKEIGFRITSIPEPTTMLLLGLGGLILRKRHGQE